MQQLPVGVEVTRGGRVESRHRVRVMVSDPAGSLVAGDRDGQVMVFPRSTVKPLQALPLVETGAADAYGVGDEDLALACASHGGEPGQVERVAAWLDRLGLGEGDLACGPHPPGYRPAAEALIAKVRPFTRLHNNCSGKHAGMLATALHLGEPVRGYATPDHPVQRRCLAVLRDLGDGAVGDAPGIDGCGIPTWPISLWGLALLGARLVTGAGMAPARQEAAARVVGAMRRHPYLVAGTGMLDTELMRAQPDVIVKTGAEGVYFAASLRHGLGLALKAEDGAQRASETALLAALDALGWLDEPARVALASRLRPTLRNHAGTEVGEIRPVLA